MAIEGKSRGVLTCRQLSFAGTTFEVASATRTKEFDDMYAQSVVLVRILFIQIKTQILHQIIFRAFQWQSLHNHLEVLSQGNCLPNPANVMRQYFAAHQRFFVALCVASKLNKAVELTRY